MAMTAALDTVFNLAVMNAGGYDMTTLSGGTPDSFMDNARDGMDALFYTVVYAMLVYMMATSSFKLIDLVPNGMMRWAGTNIASFNDRTDPIGQINYNLVYKADAMARDIDNTNRGLQNAAESFADTAKTRDMLKPQ